jgi:phosphomannomutase/phosphoglucomutase
MTINPGIFKKYDIRGKASGDGVVLTVEAAHAVGQAFGTFLQSAEGQQQVVVGRDNRESSNALQLALIEGLISAGCDVIDLGLVATPVVYWHSVYRGGCGGVMVTGSHLSADQNGFKLCIGNRTLYGDAIQSLRQIIDAGSFTQGHGTLTNDDDSQHTYMRDLGERIPPSRPVRVVIDAGNGIGGIFAPRLFELWGHESSPNSTASRTTYPHHHPNPQEPENMVDLGACAAGADVGIAFDGDADRMGAVDEKGAMIAADRLLALLPATCCNDIPARRWS